jgi:hypothetical protein
MSKEEAKGKIKKEEGKISEGIDKLDSFIRQEWSSAR